MAAFARLAEQAALDASQVNQLEALCGMILASPHNLTAYDSAEQIVDGLFLDALAGASLVGGFSGRIVDVGTGAGIPGLPLAIVFRERRFLLIDSSRKKSDFVREAVAALGLENVEVLTARVEDAARDSALRGQFGIAVAKAVAPVRVLVEWLVPMLRPDGHAVCWKGPAARGEIDEASAALAALGAVVDEMRPYRLAGTDERALVVIRRSGALPSQYPRKAGTASRQPL